MRLFLKTTLFISIAFLASQYITASNAASGYKVETDAVFYNDSQIKAADPATFSILNEHLAKDKNSVYCDSNIIYGAEPKTFKILYNSYYAKDRKNVYYLQCGRGICLADNLESADPATFEVFKEDIRYAMDKDNFYFDGTIFNNAGIAIKHNGLYNTLKGRIILAVENGGEAYYISPKEKIMFYLSRSVIAFQVMREQGLGITDANLEKIPAGGKCPPYLSSCDNPETHDSNFTKNQLGIIFIQVEASGEAWYINPSDAKRYYLGRPSDAFDIMRTFSAGISNNDFEKLKK